MKLYTMTPSRYGSRCLIQIAAKGLDIDVEVMAYPPPESFRAINPLMLVPVLDTGEALMPESQVICEYLEDRFPTPSLRPEDPGDRARMRLLIRFFELYYDPALLKVYPLFAPDAGRDPKVRDEVLAGLEKGLALIGGHLGAGAYAVGDALSLADCALAPPLLQTRVLTSMLGLPDPVERNPAVSAYYERLRANPHVAKVLGQIEPYLRNALVGGARGQTPKAG